MRRLIVSALIAVACSPACADLFVRINGKVIDAAQFDAGVRNAYRQMFYHSQPEESKVESFLNAFAWQVIDQELIGQEVGRRGIKADAGTVATRLNAFEARYRNAPDWPARRAELMAAASAQFEQDGARDELVRQVREVAAPDEATLRRYYDEHPALFTEPDKTHLSLILLRIDPSSLEAVWKQRLEEAARMRQAILDGEDFAELARKHSGDASAASGGNMGYMHRGQLDPAAQEAIDKADAGTVLEPLRTLEGIAILRINEIIPSRRVSFEVARARAADLWRRERSEAQWRDFALGLRKAAQIEFGSPFARFAKTRDEYAPPQR